ncbi:Pvc16 family protein [Embleya sp. NPDC050493]|uniref:Pvc16 family protein n=1 Tax=Embleya sp. NPDC050493 TaxID=3363989 RepID=UPI0037AA9F9C
MIDVLDLIIRETLVAGVPGLTSARIGFQPPDDDWRQRVGASTGVWVNCALVDLREDRHMRMNIRRRVTSGVGIVERREPARIRCHYLITAWNAAKDSAQIPATEQEHTVLGAILAVLLDADPLVASAILTPEQLVKVPATLREAELPVEVVPPEGFGKLAEFWGTVGRATSWRPAVYLIVTMPVPEPDRRLDGVVHTVLASYDADIGGLPGGGVGPVERLADVGGLVLDATGGPAVPAVPVADADVVLEDPAGREVARVRSGEDGRFVLVGLRPGAYLARVTAAGLPPPAPGAVHVPGSPDALIELRFT